MKAIILQKKSPSAWRRMIEGGYGHESSRSSMGNGFVLKPSCLMTGHEIAGIMNFASRTLRLYEQEPLHSGMEGLGDDDKATVHANVRRLIDSTPGPVRP